MSASTESNDAETGSTTPTSVPVEINQENKNKSPESSPAPETVAVPTKRTACILGYICDLNKEEEKEKFQLLSYVSALLADKLRNDTTFVSKYKLYMQANNISFADYVVSEEFLQIILGEGSLSNEQYNKLVNL
jgi:hypothetical protein